ncbi:MAG: DUF2279 domain-containing protein [Ignavibacteria bacterium]
MKIFLFTISIITYSLITGSNILKSQEASERNIILSIDKKSFDSIQTNNSLSSDTSQSDKTERLSGEKNSLKLNVKHKQIKEKYKINYLKTGLVVGTTIGAGIWLHNYQKNAWWSGQRTKFHFQNDWDYAMYSDKVGHIFDGVFIHNLYKGAFEWSGFKPTTAMWMGTLFSIAYLTDVEIEDGFAREWGFSPGDEIANVLGAFYPVAQYYWKPLREVNFKWSYYPSPEFLEGEKKGAFIDDYNGQTVWMSIGINPFLPKAAKKYWPDFLNIAVGYGVENYTDYNKRYPNFYIAFDYDLRKLLPGNSKFMKWFKDVINHFRIFPAPGIRINKYGTEYVINF